MNLPKTAWLCLLALAQPAQAVEFNRVLPERSRIAFVTTQMGAEVEGRFRKFRADLASVDAGSKAGNDAVKGADWLHVGAHPQARFESTSVRALGRDRYEVLGRMTIRGRSREAKARFTFRQLGSQGLFEGRFNIKRLDYGIGEAVWGDTGVVSDVVRIRFRFVADSGVPPTARRRP